MKPSKHHSPSPSACLKALTLTPIDQAWHIKSTDFCFSISWRKIHIDQHPQPSSQKDRVKMEAPTTPLSDPLKPLLCPGPGWQLWGKGEILLLSTSWKCSLSSPHRGCFEWLTAWISSYFSRLRHKRHMQPTAWASAAEGGTLGPARCHRCLLRLKYCWGDWWWSSDPVTLLLK